MKKPYSYPEEQKGQRQGVRTERRWGSDGKVGAVRWLAEWEAPHSHVGYKIGKDTLGASDPSLRPDYEAQDSSTRK